MKKQLKRHIKVKTIFSSKGCLQKKKLHMEGHCSNLILPPPPLQKQGQK